MDEIRIPPAGDPFCAAAPEHDPRPEGTEWRLGCYDGWIGHMVPTPDGGEEAKHGAGMCRHCAERGRNQWAGAIVRGPGPLRMEVPT